jgi:hypothetical protein
MRIFSVRNFSIASIAAVAFTMAFAGSDAAAAQALHKRIQGYQDEAGVFHPQGHGIAPDATVPATTGTFEVSFVITLKSPVPKGASVYCGTDVEVDSYDNTSAVTTSWDVVNYSVATVSGSKATCTVTSYYSWAVPTSSAYQNQITGAYSVAIVPESQVSFGAVGVNQANSNGPFLDLDKLPATGSITKATVDVVL